MSRTPLFREVRRAFRLARAAERLRAGSAETIERQRERAQSAGWTRRELLGAGAVLATGAALGCRTLAPAPRFTATLERPIVVVGAGIAGLTCAYRLREAGVPVRLYEAQERTGGRMYSLRDRFADGQVIELGGELIDTPHARIRALATELGIELDDLADEAPGIRAETWYFGGALRSEVAVVEAFRPVAARLEAALAAIPEGAEITYRTPSGAEALDRMTIAEWLDGAGVDGWFRDLLDVAYTTEYGLETDRQSALNFLWMIDPEPDPFRVFGESDERFHTRGGNDRIPGELARRLGATIATGHVLESVAERAGGGLTASFRRGASSVEVAASAVVLAIPFTLLREVRLDVELAPAKRRAIAELGYGTNAKLMVGFSSRPWRTQHGSNGSAFADLPFQLVWETSRKQPGAAGILTNFTGGRRGLEVAAGTAAEQAARLVADLERVFPGVAAARAGMTEARFHWPSNPWVKGSYACYLPGQWTSICGAEGEPEGDLYFCGEHASLAAQGYMEGGCETGEAAAAAILTRLGVAA
jgi:monoamine oxidase